MLSAIESCRNDLQTSMSTSQQSTACEIERLKVELERIRSDLKHEDEQIGSSQKLDLNLEKGRDRGELQKQNGRVAPIDVRLDREVSAIRAQMEAGKNDMLVNPLTALGMVKTMRRREQYWHCTYGGRNRSKSQLGQMLVPRYA